MWRAKSQQHGHFFTILTNRQNEDRGRGRGSGRGGHSIWHGSTTSGLPAGTWLRCPPSVPLQCLQCPTYVQSLLPRHLCFTPSPPSSGTGVRGCWHSSLQAPEQALSVVFLRLGRERVTVVGEPGPHAHDLSYHLPTLCPTTLHSPTGASHSTFRTLPFLGRPQPPPPSLHCCVSQRPSSSVGSAECWVLALL